jgi:hypothetical protein
MAGTVRLYSKTAPDIRGRISTGFGGNAGIPDVSLHERSDLIHTPNTVEALLQKIRSMMMETDHPSAPSCSEAL